MSHSLGDHVKALPARSSRRASDFGRRSWGLKWSNSGPKGGAAAKHARLHAAKAFFLDGVEHSITNEERWYEYVRMGSLSMRIYIYIYISKGNSHGL